MIKNQNKYNFLESIKIIPSGNQMISKNPLNAGHKGYYSTDNDNVGWDKRRETKFGGDHSHKLKGKTSREFVQLSSVGDSQPFENRPPYYAVAFIIYLGI
jgi:hypothetical protein